MVMQVVVVPNPPVASPARPLFDVVKIKKSNKPDLADERALAPLIGSEGSLQQTPHPAPIAISPSGVWPTAGQ